MDIDPILGNIFTFTAARLLGIVWNLPNVTGHCEGTVHSFVYEEHYIRRDSKIQAIKVLRDASQTHFGEAVGLIDCKRFIDQKWEEWDADPWARNTNARARIAEKHRNCCDACPHKEV